MLGTVIFVPSLHGLEPPSRWHSASKHFRCFDITSAVNSTRMQSPPPHSQRTPWCCWIIHLIDCGCHSEEKFWAWAQQNHMRVSREKKVNSQALHVCRCNPSTWRKRSGCWTSPSSAWSSLTSTWRKTSLRRRNRWMSTKVCRGGGQDKLLYSLKILGEIIFYFQRA